MARIEPLPDALEPEDVRRTFDSIRARGGEPSPLYRTLAHAPSLLEAWAAFASALRTRTSLERSIAELVIMRLAQLSQAPYQWAYHWTAALVAGLTESQLHALDRWKESPDFDARQRDALAFAEAMFAAQVGEAEIARLEAAFGKRQVIELTLTIGFYINVGRVLQALQVEVDQSRRAFLP